MSVHGQVCACMTAATRGGPSSVCVMMGTSWQRTQGHVKVSVFGNLKCDYYNACEAIYMYLQF